MSTGAAALAGTAAFSLAGGYGPQTGQQFTLATFPSHTGSFGSFEGVFVQRTRIFDPVLGATTFALNALADAADLDPAITSGLSGQNVTVNFTVTNTAGAATFTSAWTDSVFLSRATACLTPATRSTDT